MNKFMCILAVISMLLEMAGCKTVSPIEPVELTESTESDDSAETKDDDDKSYTYTDIGGTGVTEYKDDTDWIDGIKGDTPINTIAVIEEASSSSGGTDYGIICPEPPTPGMSEYPEPQAGMLTGGEWRDNDNWNYWMSLCQTHQDWSQYQKQWGMDYSNRIVVKK